jgi:hypothetical protein
MMLEVLKIFDLTNPPLDLLGKEGTFGIRYLGWNPAIPQAKSGGIRTSSATGWGSKLVYKAWENTVDVFTLVISASCPDDKIYWAQELRRLLEKAEAYWKTSWQTEPVIIEARGTGETNSRYAIIKSYVAPDDSDPYLQPFPIDSEFVLALEHTLWHDNPPYEQICAQLSSYNEFTLTTTEQYVPTVSADDAHVEYGASTISTVATDLIVGKRPGEEWGFGIRFRSVTVPAGSIIKYVGLLLVSTQTPLTDGGLSKLFLRGESNVAPAVFSTFANFTGRAVTLNSQLYDSVPYTVAGTLNSFEGFEAVVQEIIDLPGWASGNDMVIFMRAFSSPMAYSKRFASIDHLTYTEPTLVIQYTAPSGTVGTIVRSCSDDHAYISNHHKYTPLTYVFYFDSGGAVYSGNLINTLPSTLLPAVPSVGDILYIMSTELPPFGVDPAVVFYSIIFNLMGGSDFGGVWEFSTAAGWSALDVVQGYTDNTGGLQGTGEVGIFWDPVNVTGANVWAQRAVNAITGYAIRFRVTSVVGAFLPPVAPTQVTTPIYTVSWPQVEVDAGQILGDVPALVRTKVKSTRGQDVTHPRPRRVLMGTRSLSRGDRFQMWLNAYDFYGSSQGIPPIIGWDNPDIACLVTEFASWAFSSPDLWAPINRSATWNPAGADSGEIYWRIQNPTALSYYGRYRVLARVHNTTGASDITLRFLTGTSTLAFGSNLVSTYLYGETSPVLSSTERYQIVDLGVHDIPAVPIDKVGDGPESLIIGFNITNGSATPGFKVFDLALVPQDEFSWEISVPSVTFTPPGFTFGVIGVQDPSAAIGLYGYALVDSIWTRQSVKGAILAESLDTLVNNWRASTPLFNGLQSNSTQRQYFFSMEYEDTDDIWYANPWSPMTIQDWVLYQYLSMRGNR